MVTIIGTRSGSGFGAADHGRSGRHGRDLSFGGKPLFWVGVCPGKEETARVNYNSRSPKGNRHMRGLLNQAANAAVKHKGSIFATLYRRQVPRMGHNQAIGVIAHRLCRLIWKILHEGVRYEERGPAVNGRSKQKRTARMIRQLRSLGYRVDLANSPSAVTAVRRIFDRECAR
jgi:hypothetical protein